MMAAMLAGVLQRRTQPGVLLGAAGVAGVALLVSRTTWIWVGERRAEVESQDPLSMGLAGVVLAVAGVGLVALGRRRLGVAWVLSAAALSAASLARLWVDLAIDPRSFGSVFGPPTSVGAVGVFGRLCLAAGVATAALAASVLVGRRGPPRRSLVRAGAAVTAVLLLGVALDPGSMDPNMNDYYGPQNPLSPWWPLQQGAVLLRLVGAVGLTAVIIAGLIPVAHAVARSRRLQAVVGVPAFCGALAVASGTRWATAVAVAVPTALLGLDLLFEDPPATKAVGPAPPEAATGSIERLIGSGLGFARLVALAWSVVLAVAGAAGPTSGIRHVSVPWVLFGAAGAVTVAQLIRPGPFDGPRSRALVGAEVAVGLALAASAPSAADRLSRPGSLIPPGWPWPLVGVIAAGVAFGPAVGAGWGAALGLIRVAVEFRSAPMVYELEMLALVNTAALYALGGGLAGVVARRLRRAEAEVAAARAREEVARTLHDGVMQSLAVIRRRADPDVAQIAADADRELRTYLARGAGPPKGLAEVLRDAVDLAAKTHGIEPSLALDPELPELSPERLLVVRGIVAEALANAAKHAGARHITVYAGPDLVDHRTMVSVRDDGVGFDVGQVAGDRGLARSIRGRAREAGIRLEVHSEPGRGTEVCLWP